MRQCHPRSRVLKLRFFLPCFSEETELFGPKKRSKKVLWGTQNAKKPQKARFRQAKKAQLQNSRVGLNDSAAPMAASAIAASDVGCAADASNSRP
jgi:hypothetical protein